MALTDLMALACGGALGGAIYWAGRAHGQVFAALWQRIARS